MGSIFASHTTDTIPIPSDPPHTATIRKLTGRELDRAQEVHLRATIGGRWAAHGWAATFQQQLAKGTATAADAERLLMDPLIGYDRHALVEDGLTAWSYTEPERGAKAIEDLDDDALDYFARAILKLSKPSLFLTADEAEAVKKTASAPSISV